MGEGHAVPVSEGRARGAGNHACLSLKKNATAREGGRFTMLFLPRKMGRFSPRKQWCKRHAAEGQGLNRGRWGETYAVSLSNVLSKGVLL